MISTGLTYLDKLTGGLKNGDNVVWEAADGVPVEDFIRSFFDSAKDFSNTIIYINFNFSPQTILKRYDYLFKRKNAILVDAFTHGKGNGDSVFLDFYNSDQYDRDRIIKIENPKNITSFVSILNEIELKHKKEGTFYIFDGVTGMHELWKDESAVLDFFTFTCPKLYDLNALAYWIIRREAHSREFIAGIMHITQIVFSVKATDSEYYELQVHKLQDRTPLYGSQPSYFRIIDNNIVFDDKKASETFKIGEKVKNLRKEARMTQAELAMSLSMTPGAVSQIENDIITPSLQTLIQLSSVFTKPTDYFFGLATHDGAARGYSFTKKSARIPLAHREADIAAMIESDRYGMQSYCITLERNRTVDGPILLHKGKEFIIVTEGALEVIINEESIIVAEGDSLLLTDIFVSRWRCSGAGKCVFFYILS
jgi:transcriptional regulator with XRE-family HTH domain